VQGGATPLYIAAQEGHWKAVMVLLEHEDIDVNKAEEVRPAPRTRRRALGSSKAHAYLCMAWARPRTWSGACSE